ncbi:MAG: NADH-quinone oxidoreductase subunit L, partial [Deltaproteobacteria bacterium]|nr:NADH-quinone oxidoreductase subunit L [Deltaproteobacteria bacterium]
SQLGYMMAGLGVGSLVAGIFHLFTHAFFKALLFLAAGSVMHALQGELDMRRMGGLRAKLQTTHFTFVIGALALAGIPPFAGFFSKDEILWQAFARGHWALWLLATFGAGLTAFYIFRLIFLTFYGPSRVPAAVEHHVHESPGIMTRPLLALAILATVGGLVGVPFVPQGNRLEEFLEPAFREATVRIEASAGEPLHSAGAESLLILLSLAVAGAGIALAYWAYVKRPVLARRWGAALPWLYRLLLNKYYVDELYGAVLVRPLVQGSRVLWRVFDDLFIDGLVNGTAGLIALGARVIRRIQTGYAQNYALSIALGAVLCSCSRRSQPSSFAWPAC